MYDRVVVRGSFGSACQDAPEGAEEQARYPRGASQGIFGDPLGQPRGFSELLGGPLGAPQGYDPHPANYDARGLGPPNRYCKQYLEQITGYW